jgi:plasmid maintenance system antidote protein VapI
MGNNTQLPNKQALRDALKRRKMKMKDLVPALGISRSTLSQKVNGRYQFTISEANEIRKHVGLTADEFMEIFCG